MIENEDLNVLILQNHIKNILESLSQKYIAQDGFVPQSEIWQKILQENEAKGTPVEENQLLNLFQSALFGSSRSLNIFECQEKGEEISWRCRIFPKSGAITNQDNISSKKDHIQELQNKLRLLRIHVSSLEAENANLTIQKENLKIRLPQAARETFDLYEANYSVIQRHNVTLNTIQSSLHSILNMIPSS